MRQAQTLIAGAFAHYGQPSAEPRFDAVKMVANACLRHLLQNHVGKSKKDIVENAASIKKLEHGSRINNKAVGRGLN